MGILELSSMDVAGEASLLACENQVEPNVNSTNANILANFVGVPGVTCWDGIIWDSYCSRADMTGVRALCPVTCGCNQPVPFTSGLFQVPRWGCPTSCLSFWPLDLSYYPCNDDL